MIQRTCPHQHQPSTGKVEPKRMKLRVPHPSSVFLLDGWETTNANRRPSGLSRHFFLVTHRLCQPTGDETAGAPSGRPLGRTSLSLSDGWETTKANHRNRVFPSSVLFLIRRTTQFQTQRMDRRLSSIFLGKSRNPHLNHLLNHPAAAPSLHDDIHAAPAKFTTFIAHIQQRLLTVSTKTHPGESEEARRAGKSPIKCRPTSILE